MILQLGIPQKFMNYRLSLLHVGFSWLVIAGLIAANVGGSMFDHQFSRSIVAFLITAFWVVRIVVLDRPHYFDTVIKRCHKKVISNSQVCKLFMSSRATSSLTPFLPQRPNASSRSSAQSHESIRTDEELVASKYNVQTGTQVYILLTGPSIFDYTAYK